MLRALVVFVATGCSLWASAQSAECDSDQQCQRGFYCVPDVFLCRRCLDCEVFKRDPPRVPTACIKSVAECGSCIKGLVDDLRGDVTAECVAETGSGEVGTALPAWAWAAVILGLLLFALVVVAVLYVLRNTNTFKILASTRTSVRSPGVEASAPDAPPPYRAHYHHHNNHNDHRDHHDTDHYDTDTDTGHDRDHRDLLPDAVDPTAPCEDVSPPGSPRAAYKPRPPPPGPREAAACQETLFYNTPYYVRPPRYSDAGVSSPAPPTHPLAPAPPPLHDEDTMESTWTPSSHDDNGNIAGGGELAELLAAARLSDQHHLHQNHHNSHHHPCTQDSNNNRSSGSSTGGAAPRPPPHASPAPPPPVSYIINVVQNMQNRA